MVGYCYTKRSKARMFYILNILINYGDDDILILFHTLHISKSSRGSITLVLASFGEGSSGDGVVKFALFTDMHVEHMGRQIASAFLPGSTDATLLQMQMQMQGGLAPLHPQGTSNSHSLRIYQPTDECLA